MKLKLSKWAKIGLAVVCFGIAIIGFMAKLPSGFRHIDKELHSLFYFIAAAFLNILFTNRKFYRHVLIFIVLYLFGVVIERAQAYSNKFFHSRIHGRYDPEDVQSNLNGLIAFSVLWIIYIAVSFLYSKVNSKVAVNNGDRS
jgi:uncharacterized membrane protein